MSRKSARLQSKAKPSDKLEICHAGSRKRKAEEDLEGEMAVNKRRQQFRIENQWVPISENSSVTSSAIVPTAIEPQHSTPPELLLGSQFRFRNFFTTPASSRFSPLPKFNWADSQEVWQLMLKKEHLYVRSSCVFDRHPSLQPRMRSILLDWLIEVCEVYRLHRESLYLAADFIDRFLSIKTNIMKHQLQLIGISALFIAAKLEEIYPPKLKEFAYVTDGACNEDEILDQELVILKALNWDLSPVTVDGWLNIYLQVANVDHILETEHGFVFPQYSSHAFVNIARLTDLCLLDSGCFDFSYSVLSASALYHMSSMEIALSVSGLKWQDILSCVQWMSPFAMAIRDAGPVEVKFFPTVNHEDSHNIQTHAVDLNLLEKAQERQQELLNSDRSSPDLQAQVITQLTPPQSNKKTVIKIDDFVQQIEEAD